MKKSVLPALLVLFLSLSLSAPGATLAADTVEAKIEKYQQAVRENPNDAEGHFKLGLAYAELQRYEEAVAEIRLAAEQGLAEAQYSLGVMYYHGQDVPKDYKQAVKWYRLSAEQGDAEAQYRLGVMYEDGRGVLQNYVLAHMWFNLATMNGAMLSLTSRDALTERMTATQIAEAREMARQWVAAKEN